MYTYICLCVVCVCVVVYTHTYMQLYGQRCMHIPLYMNWQVLTTCINSYECKQRYEYMQLYVLTNMDMGMGTWAKMGTGPGCGLSSRMTDELTYVLLSTVKISGRARWLNP